MSMRAITVKIANMIQFSYMAIFLDLNWIEWMLDLKATPKVTAAFMREIIK